MKNNNRIKVYYGEVGQGKTIYMSYIAHRILEEDEDITAIYSNYDLLNTKTLTLHEKISNAVIAIDEAQHLKHLNYDLFENCIILLTVNRIEFLQPKYRPDNEYHYFKVVREDDLVLIEEKVDWIKIDAFKHLYNAFRPANLNL